MTASRDDLTSEQHWIAMELARSVFPNQNRMAAFGKDRGQSMYTLNKAKEEIDLLAKHATDLAEHMLVMNGTLETRLESFKADILSAIDTKFAELSRSIHGDEPIKESSALADLGAKVSLLTHKPSEPIASHEEHPDHPPASGNYEHQDTVDNHDVHQDHGSDNYGHG